MQSNFQLTDDALSQYFKVYAQACNKSVDTNFRELGSKIVENQAFWSKVIEASQSSDDASVAISRKLEFPLYLINNLSELLVNRLLPVNLLIDGNIPLIKEFRIFVLKNWASCFVSNYYSEKFETVIDFVVRIITPMCEYSGRSFQLLLDQFCEEFKTFNLIDIAEQDLDQLHKNLIGLYQEFSKKTRVFEERVLLAERQQASNQLAKREAARTLSVALKGEEIPYWAFKFINDHWQKLLHLSFIKKDNNDAISKSEELLGEFIWSLKIETPEEMMTALAARISPLRKSIRELFDTIVVDEQSMEEFFEEMEQYHLAIMQGYPLHQESVVFKNIYDDDSGDDVDLKDVSVCKVGNWFKLHRDEKEYHARVAERDLQNKKVVFVNYSGARVDSLSFSSYVEQVNKKEIEVISLTSKLEDYVNEINQYALSQVAAIKLKLKEKNQKKLEQEEAKRVAESRLEKLRLEQEQLVEKKRQEKKKQKETQLRKVAEAKEFALKLVPGATFVNHADDDIILQYALKLRQSGKMIFVNKQGVKYAELDPGEFAEKLVSGDYELLTQVQSTELTLEQMVATQRTKLKGIRT